MANNRNADASKKTEMLRSPDEGRDLDAVKMISEDRNH